ncbi:hypothetical protein Avbf_00690, partial [Armadillidium vulgare]
SISDSISDSIFDLIFDSISDSIFDTISDSIFDTISDSISDSFSISFNNLTYQVAFSLSGTGVGTPLSSTVSAPGAPDGLMKGSLPEKESKKEELPDLSSLKTEISILLEGRNSEGQIGRGSKYCVFILGKLDECGKGTKDVIKTVNEEISTNLNEKGIEALLINVHLSVALYNTPFSPSELLSEYIKEQNCFSSIFVILLRGTNPETYDLPTHISEGDFSVLIETLDEKESKDLIEKWYVKDQHRESFRKLQPAPTIYKQLLSEKTEEYNKAYEAVDNGTQQTHKHFH